MIFQLEIPVYGTTIVFLVESTVREFDKFYNKNKDRFTEEEYDLVVKDISDPSRCNGFTMSLDLFADYMVYVRDAFNPEYVIHELFHVANKILCYRGVTFDPDAEAWAYLIGYIAKVFYKELDVLKAKREKAKDKS